MYEVWQILIVLTQKHWFKILLEELATKDGGRKVAKRRRAARLCQVYVRPEEAWIQVIRAIKFIHETCWTLDESPRLVWVWMTMEKTTFPWHLDYDEVDYVIAGRLDIIVGDEVMTAGPGEVLLSLKAATFSSLSDKGPVYLA